MNDSLIYNLREALLINTSKKADQKIFDSLVEAILDTTNCSMCSLWSINNNSTPGKKEDIFQSISIIARKLKCKEYDFNDSVLELKGTFIQKTIKNTKPYYIGDRSDHKNKDCLEILNLNYFIGIPIPDFSTPTKTIAVLKLSYTDTPKIEHIELFAIIIRDYISSTLYRHMVWKKQQVMDDLIKNYKEKGQKKIANIFYPILHNILPKYCIAEASSVFIWDSYNYRYNLLRSTAKLTNLKGVEIKNHNAVFYLVGEGLTGKVAAEGEDARVARIYDNLEQLEKDNNPDYEHKYREITTHIGKTMLVVPILRPSNPKEVIGIIRFVNKINPKGSVVDYFNDEDAELVNYASNYLALNIDYFLGEEDRSNFISKLSHESSNPAIAIRGTADRIKRKMGDPAFMRFRLNAYLESIINFANLQIQQASTNLYISKNHRDVPKSKKYTIRKYSLLHLIKQSKETVIPLAREIGLSFDDIKIENELSKWELYVDEPAFVAVFYNLLTNAIKYHNPQTKFSVKIRGEETEESLLINVSDNGLGILEKDVEKIFLLGVRGVNVSKYNVNGYGIGLHVIKQIIKDFDGAIRVQNCNSPTIFEIKLPKKLFNNKYTQSEKWNQ
ncbi:CAI-1 autoinducer sensor kinase/phosphatase CqsS [termite gut metagenome]|uniref:CAI-1 autoinducer sensor kinase/phosphatase CqsS n=1 Tax=termite gut metagenome TaxID=433724 RepID=A0A5J4RQH8_9ZZZZ